MARQLHRLVKVRFENESTMMETFTAQLKPATLPWSKYKLLEFTRPAKMPP